MQTINELDQDLEWQAYCYISGELSAEGLEAFEARLVDDQQAREAVARAVELVHAIALAVPRTVEQPLPARLSRRSTWPRRLAWMAAGATAALVLVAIALNWQAIPNPFGPVPIDRRQLAEVWSQTRDEVRQIVHSEPIELPPLMDTDHSAEDTLPSWMTAAVFNQAADPELDRPSTHDES